MQTALHRLIQSAPACAPIKADLRHSTVTLDWPANSLIQRTPYVLLPLADVQAAIASDAHLVAMQAYSGPGKFEAWADDRSFSFMRGGFDATFHFYRETKGGRPPGTWLGRITVIDTDGNEWDRFLPGMVTNDFGDLVSLRTGERP